MEFRSSASLLGLPLVHVATSTVSEGRYRRGIATGWIAIGDVAFGVLFACGGVAFGGFSLGGVALGLLSFGGAAIGLLAFGGLGVGVAAVGGAAIAWYAAVGGLAVAHDIAIGGLALAREVIAPPGRNVPPFAAIPHPPFRWSDALLLVLIVVGLLLVARAIQERRSE